MFGWCAIVQQSAAFGFTPTTGTTNSMITITTHRSTIVPYLLASKKETPKPPIYGDMPISIPIPPRRTTTRATDSDLDIVKDSMLSLPYFTTNTTSMTLYSAMEDVTSNDSPSLSTVADVGHKKERDKIVMLALLWCIAAISALDRVAMSVALIPMSTELNLSNTIMGSISSIFSVGYGIGILPAGVLLATVSPRSVLAFGIVLWSLATFATPISAELLLTQAQNTLLPLLLVRALVGGGESFVIPTIQRLLAVWTTTDQKSLAFAFIFSGFQTGTIAAYLVSPMVMEIFGGWRGLFYVYGVIGMLITLPWLLLAKDEPTLIVTDSSVENIKSIKNLPSWKDSLKSFQQAPWKDFLQSKGVWGILLAHSAKNYALYNSLAWSPTFYSQQYGVSVKESAWLSVLPSVAGVLGGFAAGTCADTILRNGEISVQATTRVRKNFQTIGLLGPAMALGCLAVYTPDDAGVAQCYLTAAVGLQSFNSAGMEAGGQDKAGPKWVGMLYGVTTLPAVISKLR